MAEREYQLALQGLRNPELQAKDTLFKNLLSEHYEPHLATPLAEILTDFEKLTSEVTNGQAEIAVGIVEDEVSGEKSLSARAFVEETEKHAEIVERFGKAKDNNEGTNIMLEGFFESSSMDNSHMKIANAVSKIFYPKFKSIGLQDDVFLSVFPLRRNRNEAQYNKAEILEAVIKEPGKKTTIIYS